MRKVLLGLLIAANIAMLTVIIWNPSGGGKNIASTPVPPAPISRTPAPQVAETETDPPAEAASEAPVEAPPEAPAALPYADSLAAPAPTDFAWIADAQSGSLGGTPIGQDAFIGKWKGEFVFDSTGVWELVTVTVGTDASITVQPYKINYGDGWVDESGDAAYTFGGAFDVGGVQGGGNYGSMTLYAFYDGGGVQYGLGTFVVQSGEAANVYLVRP